MTDAATPLSLRLREETKDAHTRAERSGIMRRVLKGEIDRAQYVDLLDQLTVVYGALEDALARHATRPVLAPFALDRLRRLPKLHEDITSLGMSILRRRGTSDAAIDLVERIRAADARAPERLLAHAYVRYLGDLSGGQILRRLVSRALALADDEGTAFYDFAPHDVDALKRDFRTTLDTVPLTHAERDAIVDEALHGFALHERLFVELDHAPS